MGGGILRFCVIRPHTECRFSKMEMIKSSQRAVGEGKAGARVKSLTVAMSSSAVRSAVGKYTCGGGEGKAPGGDVAGGAAGERMLGAISARGFRLVAVIEDKHTCACLCCLARVRRTCPSACQARVHSRSTTAWRKHERYKRNVDRIV